MKTQLKPKKKAAKPKRKQPNPSAAPTQPGFMDDVIVKGPSA